MDFADYWRQLRPWAQGLAIVLPILGFTGAIVGTVVLGETDWWDPKGFGVNVVTSFVGALIGIPLAVVVIGWLTANHGDRIETAEVSNLTATAWLRLRESVLAHTAPNPQPIIEHARSANLICLQIRERIIRYSQLAGAQGRSPYNYTLASPDAVDADAVRDEFRELLSSLNSHAMKIRQLVGSEDEFRRGWFDARMRWEFLSTDVRRLRYGQGLGWLPADHEVELAMFFSAGTSPRGGADLAIRQYQGLAEELSNWLPGPLEGLLNYQLYESKLQQVERYDGVGLCEATVNQLQALRTLILEADGDTWRSPARVS